MGGCFKENTFVMQFLLIYSCVKEREVLAIFLPQIVRLHDYVDPIKRNGMKINNHHGDNNLVATRLLVYHCTGHNLVLPEIKYFATFRMSKTSQHSLLSMPEVE